MVCRDLGSEVASSAARRNWVASAASDFFVFTLDEDGGDGAHFGIRGADFLDARVVGLQQIEELRRFDFGRILKFEERVRFGFFGRPKLHVDGTGDLRIVVIELAHFLLEVIGHQPDFRAVVGNKSGEDELDDRLVGRVELPWRGDRRLPG